MVGKLVAELTPREFVGILVALVALTCVLVFAWRGESNAAATFLGLFATGSGLAPLAMRRRKKDDE